MTDLPERLRADHKELLQNTLDSIMRDGFHVIVLCSTPAPRTGIPLTKAEQVEFVPVPDEFNKQRNSP